MLIAEIGNNHDGVYSKAIDLIGLASECGVRHVKFQIFKAEKLVHPDMPAMVPTHKTQLERMKSLEFSDEQWEGLYRECENVGVNFLATCFDIETLRQWAPRLSHIKIASGDITYTGLIREAVVAGKPILLSTGASSLYEIEKAAQWIPRDLLTVLHCVCSYPCRPENANLGVIPQLKQKYKRVGYSDHVLGIDACLVAYSMGMEVIEKHFTDEHREYGDHIHSCDPLEMSQLVNRIKEIKEMCGTEKPAKEETSLRRGMYAKHPIEKGHILTEDDVLVLRPQASMVGIGTKTRKEYKELEAVG